MSTVVNMMTLILPATDDLVSRMAGVMTGYTMIPGRGTSFKGRRLGVRLHSLQHGPIFGLHQTQEIQLYCCGYNFFQFVQVEWRRSR